MCVARPQFLAWHQQQQRPLQKTISNDRTTTIEHNQTAYTKHTNPQRWRSMTTEFYMLRERMFWVNKYVFISGSYIYQTYI